MTITSARIHALLALALFLVSIVGCNRQAGPIHGALQPQKDRQPAPNFVLKDASGETVQLKDYSGKVLLLNFWATWCGGCKLEIPWFQEFESKLGPQKFAVLGVSVDEEGWKAVTPFVEKTGVTYRMVLADKATPQAYAVSAMPATFLIDPHGRVAANYVGVVDRKDIEGKISTVLSEN